MSGISEDEVSRLALEAGIQIWDIGADDCRTASQLRKFNRLKRFATLVEKTTLEKAALLREQIALQGVQSNDYENGFWDGLGAYEKAIRSMK